MKDTERINGYNRTRFKQGKCKIQIRKAEHVEESKDMKSGVGGLKLGKGNV